jgi:hypothetical protein
VGRASARPPDRFGRAEARPHLLDANDSVKKSVLTPASAVIAESAKKRDIPKITGSDEMRNVPRMVKTLKFRLCL